jgi:glycosyltransferase involved in cell wall biosynthesis
MRVHLTTEGTYPFVVGGVSTWADLLVRGLEEREFFLTAVVDNPFHPLAFSPPRNVVLQPVPLWGSELVNEHLAVPGSWRRALRTSSKEVRGRFLPCWEPFLDALAAREASSAALGNALAGVAHFAERYDLRRALAHPAAWAALLAALRSNPLMARARCDGAIEFGRSLFRFLLPLCVPVPRCDVVHTSAAGLCALPAVVAKYRHGTPMLLTEHGIYLRERLMGLSALPLETKLLQANFFRAVTELAYREADLVTPVCGYNAAWEQSLGVEPERIRVVYNGISRHDLASLALPDGQGPPTVGYVGRIDPLKDVVTLIRAFAVVHAALPSARLRLWGPPSSTEYLGHCKDVAERLGLWSHIPGANRPVSFEGRTDQPAAAYSASDVVALSSVTEGFPYTVVESMLAARPVVSTDVGGVAEALAGISVVPGGDGREMLVEPGDPQALGRALLAVLGTPLARRVAAGLALRQRALERFDVGTFLEGYRQAYDDLAPLRGGEPRNAVPWGSTVPEGAATPDGAGPVTVGVARAVGDIGSRPALAKESAL